MGYPPKAAFIAAAASSVAASTLLPSVAIFCTAVGTTSCASIFDQEDVVGMNFVPFWIVAMNGTRNGSFLASSFWTSPKVGMLPIASYIFWEYFLPPSSSTNWSASVRRWLDWNTPSTLPPAKAGAMLPGVVPGNGTTEYLPFTAPASTAL